MDIIGIFKKALNLIGGPKKIGNVFEEENKVEKKIEETLKILLIVIIFNILGFVITSIMSPLTDASGAMVSQLILITMFFVTFFIGALAIHGISKHLFKNEGKFTNIAYLLAIMAVLNAILNTLLLPLVLIKETQGITSLLSTIILSYKLYLDFFAIKSTYKLDNMGAAKVFLTNIVIWILIIATITAIFIGTMGQVAQNGSVPR
jgi:uncharacterized membrane protein